MSKLYIMQGIPGSGKSTFAKLLVGGHPDAEIHSTDQYWYQRDPNVYDYVPALAHIAHRWNQQNVIRSMQAGVQIIVVDNTNITREMAKPYIVMADVYGYDWTVIRVDVPVEVAIARQGERPEDRRVPEEIIRSMHSRLQTITLPTQRHRIPIADPPSDGLAIHGVHWVWSDESTPQSPSS